MAVTYTMIPSGADGARTIGSDNFVPGAVENFSASDGSCASAVATLNGIKTAMFSVTGNGSSDAYRSEFGGTDTGTALAGIEAAEQQAYRFRVATRQTGLSPRDEIVIFQIHQTAAMSGLSFSPPFLILQTPIGYVLNIANTTDSPRDGSTVDRRNRIYLGGVGPVFDEFTVFVKASTTAVGAELTVKRNGGVVYTSTAFPTMYDIASSYLYIKGGVYASGWIGSPRAGGVSFDTHYLGFVAGNSISDVEGVALPG